MHAYLHNYVSYNWLLKIINSMHTCKVLFVGNSRPLYAARPPLRAPNKMVGYPRLAIRP